MEIEQEVFQRAKVDFSKLLEFGFSKTDTGYCYTRVFYGNQFLAEITVTREGLVQGKVIDLEFAEEYTNIRTEMTGAFVNAVREAYEEILCEIKEACFEESYFFTEQTNRITQSVMTKYNTKPEFLWKKFPNFAVFRNAGSEKWFALVMLLDKYKIDPTEHKAVEVLNVKLDEEKVEALRKRDGFYKAYHIRSKAWVTILLDETIEDEEIMELIEFSFQNTQNTKKRQKA